MENNRIVSERLKEIEELVRDGADMKQFYKELPRRFPFEFFYHTFVKKINITKEVKGKNGKTVIKTEPDANARISASNLYGEYLMFAKKYNLHVPNKNLFGAIMGNLFESDGVGKITSSCYYYIGVKFSRENGNTLYEEMSNSSGEEIDEHLDEEVGNLSDGGSDEENSIEYMEKRIELLKLELELEKLKSAKKKTNKSKDKLRK